MIDLYPGVLALFEEAQQLASYVRPQHLGLVYDGRRTPAPRRPRQRTPSPWLLVDRPASLAPRAPELQPATCACGAHWEARHGATRLAHVGRTLPGCRPVRQRA